MTLLGRSLKVLRELSQQAVQRPFLLPLKTYPLRAGQKSPAAMGVNIISMPKMRCKPAVCPRLLVYAAAMWLSLTWWSGAGNLMEQTSRGGCSPCQGYQGMPATFLTSHANLLLAVEQHGATCEHTTLVKQTRLGPESCINSVSPFLLSGCAQLQQPLRCCGEPVLQCDA